MKNQLPTFKETVAAVVFFAVFFGMMMTLGIPV